MLKSSILCLTSLLLLSNGVGAASALSEEAEEAEEAKDEQQATPEDTIPLTLESDPRRLPAPVADLMADDSIGYRIGRQDLLEIRVFGVDEFDQAVRVADDGTITLPLLGRIDVRGMTKSELEQRLAALLGERYIRDPQVSVFVRDYESRRVAVTGAVKNPGTYEMLGRRTLLEMVSMAGGLDGELGHEIFIFRRDDDGGTRRVAVELDRLVYDADPSLNHAIRPGDIIYVPTVEKIGIFVSGAVTNPDRYEVPRDEPVTVLKAITIAGGTTDRAALKKVQIMRTDENGLRTTLLVDLKKIKRGKAEDPILRPDDIVLVPESFF